MSDISKRWNLCSAGETTDYNGCTYAHSFHAAGFQYQFITTYNIPRLDFIDHCTVCTAELSNFVIYGPSNS